MLDCSCARSHGTVRTPTRVVSASKMSPFGVLVLAEERRARAPVVVEAEHRARREVDAGVLAAEREVLRGAQRDEVLEQVDAAVDEGVLRFGIAVRQTGVGDVPRAGADRVVVGIATQLRADQLALRAGLEHFLPIRLAFEREALGEAIAAIDADLARARFAARLLTDAEARLLLAHVGTRVEPLAHVHELR